MWAWVWRPEVGVGCLLEVSTFNVGVGAPNSGPCAGMAKTLQTESLPQLPHNFSARKQALCFSCLTLTKFLHSVLLGLVPSPFSEPAASRGKRQVQLGEWD